MRRLSARIRGLTDLHANRISRGRRNLEAAFSETAADFANYFGGIDPVVRRIRSVLSIYSAISTSEDGGAREGGSKETTGEGASPIEPEGARTNGADAFLRSYIKYATPLSGDHANRHRTRCHRVGELLACTSDIQKFDAPGHPVR